ncbi:hypothetical protein SGLAM104S_00295 [Streptomyces glaucescens]
MIRRRTLLTATGGALLASAVVPAGTAHADATIAVNPGTTYGTWEGWGTSLALAGHVFGARDDFADLFFTTKSVSGGRTLPWPGPEHRPRPWSPTTGAGTAQEALTEAATLLLPPGTAPSPSVRPVLVARHRIRRMENLPHDDWDTQADTLHSLPVSLDELHDPKRVWSLGSENPAELRAEISRLQAELGAYREALSRPFPVAMLHWPAVLSELVREYPGSPRSTPPTRRTFSDQ